MEKYASIPVIKGGLVFSDPWYGDDVWCQYRKEFEATDWYMKLNAYNQDDMTHFTVHIGRNTVCADTRLDHDKEEGTYSVIYPQRYDLSTTELGMDTASIYCGNKNNWQQFAEEAAIDTGTDGFFGDLFEFTVNGDKDPAGYILVGAVDDMFIDEDELFSTLLSNFEAQEISKELYAHMTSRNSLPYKLNATLEIRTSQETEKAGKGSPEKEPPAPER